MEEKVYNLAKMCEPAISQLDDFCKANGLAGLVKADLVCIKCSSKEIYNARRVYYDTESRFLYQALVAGRRIAVVGLKEVLTTSVGDIVYLEICDQKPDNSQTDRLSHIGIVPSGISYDELVKKLETSGSNLKKIARPDGYSACDITLSSGFIIRLQKERLLDRIKREEMV